MQRHSHWKTPSRENRYGLFYRNTALTTHVVNKNADTRESDTRIVVGGTHSRSHIMSSSLLFKRKKLDKTLEFLLDLAFSVDPGLRDAILDRIMDLVRNHKHLVNVVSKNFNCNVMELVSKWNLTSKIQEIAQLGGMVRPEKSQLINKKELERDLTPRPGR